MDFVLLLLGVPLGVVASLFAWYVLFHSFSPRLSFSKSISEQRRASGEIFHRIMIVNSGHRTVIDLDIHVRLLATGIGRFPHNWYGVDVPITLPKVPILYKGRNKIFGFKLDCPKVFDRDTWGNNIVDKAQKNSLLISDLLDIGTDAYIQVFVFGYDEISGSRHLNMSHSYRLSNIEEATFKNISLVKSDKDHSFLDRATTYCQGKMRLVKNKYHTDPEDESRN